MFSVVNSPKLISQCCQRFLAYKSDISLKNLHPQSSNILSTPDPPKRGSELEFNGFIPMEQLEVTYSRSSGPGGQNVNKVNTKVEVRFHLQSAKWLSDNIKSKLSQKVAKKITKEGHIIFRSDITRSQHLNLADCLEKLRQTIRESLVEKAEPSEDSQERFRKLKEKAARERLALKRQKSILKNERREVEMV